MPSSSRIFPGFRPAALTFLRGLARNNRREWFNERKDEYTSELLTPMRALVEEMDVRFARFAPEMVGDPKRSIFRIHRDIRFSKDKSPYKTHVACWFFHRDTGRAGGAGSSPDGGAAGFYFHLEPRRLLVAAGLWLPPREALALVRQAIAREQETFEKIVQAPPLRRRFGALRDEHMLTRIPRGYATDHPAGRWLRFQSFTVSRALGADAPLDYRLPELLEKDFRIALPLVRWLNAALHLREAPVRRAV